ncbi:MAG: glycosyltransferase [Verrucomicrobia bacterium]|nr:glycosyltransferase [Verrucomicrobiota bacterium]MDA1067657.1 glycosyltransferase [Verrucomicrobiota bacterium]
MNASTFDRLLWKFRPFKKVHLRWWLELKWRNLFTKKIKVGFGHLHTDETTLTNRKWHIDPIVNGINKYSDRYVADIFFPCESLSRFDIIVMLKHIEFITEPEIVKLKQAGKKILFNISDNPSSCELNYETTTWFLDSLDALLLLNPLQGENLSQYAHKFRSISPPIIDDRHKQDYSESSMVKIFWDGFADNLYTLDRLIRIVKEVAQHTSVKIEMLINSNIPERDDGNVKYRAWNIKTWRSRMLECDIGALIKPMDDRRQQKKPPTKLITYMSGGLPVICTPSGSDKTVMEHGKTGFYAYTDEEWFHYLKLLIEDVQLRERIGRAAREYALSKYSIEMVTNQYTSIFDGLMKGPVLNPLRQTA